jgi:hypothetical protein
MTDDDMEIWKNPEYIQKFPNIAQMVKQWELSHAKIEEDKLHDKILFDDLPPYFMTLTDAVLLLIEIGFAPTSKSGQRITSTTVEYWEDIIAKHGGE